jgi:hypothetical protein
MILFTVRFMLSLTHIQVELINNYMLLHTLGTGGYGVVKLAITPPPHPILPSAIAEPVAPLRFVPALSVSLSVCLSPAQIRFRPKSRPPTNSLL